MDTHIPCRCDEFRFSNSGEFEIVHSPSCPFSRLQFSDGYIQWHLQRALSNSQRNVQRGGDVVPAYDEYFRAIPFSNLQAALNTFRIRRSYATVGYGRPLLSFVSGGTNVKKALRGGVHFRLSRLHVVESASSKVSADTKLKDVMGSFSALFADLVEKLKRTSKPGDLVQFVVYTEKTPGFDGDTGMKNPVTTPFTDISLLNKYTIVPFLVSNFHEYDHIVIGDQIIVESVTVRMGNLSQGEIDAFVNAGFDKWLKVLDRVNRVQGVVRIQNFDCMCLSRSVVVALFHLEMMKQKKGTEAFKIAENEYACVRSGGYHQRQLDYAFFLCSEAGVKAFCETSDSDVEKIAQYLKVEIKIVSAENYSCIRRFGDHSARDKLYLLERSVRNSDDIMSPLCVTDVSSHLDAIVNIKTLVGTAFYCKYCDVGYESVESHKCKDCDSWCYACFSRECFGNSIRHCKKCSISVRSGECLERHLKHNVCHKYVCKRCNRRVVKKRKSDGTFESYDEVRKRHVCMIMCSLCGREKKNVHKCYMRRVPFKDRCLKFMFIDFETDQSSGVHIPVCCFAKWVEFDVDVESGEETVWLEDERFFGVHYLVSSEVGQFLFSQQFSGYTVIAHNMKGFDGCFLLRYLLEHNIEIKVIANGLKLTSISVPSLNMRLIDSLNFFQMSLSGIVSAMGLEHSVSSKGFFPHFFTRPCNLTYKGPMPDLEYYGCYDMKAKQCKELVEWHAERVRMNDVFDYRKEIEKYCKQDVVILYAGCLKFRSDFIDVVKQIPDQPDILDDEAFVVSERKRRYVLELNDPYCDDPLEGLCDESKHDEFDLKGVCDPFSYLTIPGVCSAVFKARFLKRNSIAQIPVSGYTNFRHSQVGLEYCEYIRISKYSDLQHAQNTYNGREVSISVDVDNVSKTFRVDGFSPSSNTVVEFYGCFWHGCPKCIKDMNVRQPVRGITYDMLYKDTLNREDILRKAGYVVESIWECEWLCLKKHDECVRDVCSKIHVKSRLSPRDAFRGGRTETARMLWDVQSSQYGIGVGYCDVVSLYPTVNLNDEYPVGHPEIITNNFDFSLNSYFGLVHCAVLPPRNLENGVLPFYSNGKLMFPLCRMCVERLQIDVCSHDESERLLIGVWVSKELQQAIKYGYEIKQIYCVHHFSRTSKDLFSGYIRTFYKLKLASSKRPENETPEQLSAFIDEVKDIENILISPDDFKDNPGVRSIAKLCCNSFWGRLGMRDAFPRVEFVRTHEQLLCLFSDPHWNVTSIRYISPNCIAVLLTNKSVDTLEVTNNTNIYAAVFTTAYARIRLYEFLYKVGGRLLYCDTDSIIYELSPNASENLPLGFHMGELTNELDEGEVIIRFVSGGPKVYAYITNKGKCVVKVKGFQITERTKSAFSFDNLWDIISSHISSHMDTNIGRVRNETDTKIAASKYACLRDELFDKVHRNQEHGGFAVTNEAISIYNVNRILRTNAFELIRGVEQKMYKYNFNKRIVLSDYRAVPYGYVSE